MQQYEAYICYETQALAMHIVEAINAGTTFDIDGYTVGVQVTTY